MRTVLLLEAFMHFLSLPAGEIRVDRAGKVVMLLWSRCFVCPSNDHLEGHASPWFTLCRGDRYGQYQIS